MLNPAQAADKNVTSGNIEYYVTLGDKIAFTDNRLNISAGNTLEFRIFDNSTKVFTTNGEIKIGDDTAKIESHSFTEDLKDRFRKLISSVFGGESTVGNNSEYYAEYKFNENSKAESYSVIVKGIYNSNSTINTITIYVQSRYITKTVGSPGRTYDAPLKNLSARSLKYHTDTSQTADNLIKNIREFLDASNDLHKKILNLTDNPDNTEFKDSVSKVKVSRDGLKKSMKEYEDKVKDDKPIKDQSTNELKLINEDMNIINSELITIFITKRDSLLTNELKAAQGREKNSSDQFESTMSDYRTGVFVPAGAMILLGLIIGYFNVNRWKKESEYFGLYTSKANITSPITIAIILTVVISILIGIIIYIEGDLNMFKFLI